MECNIFEVETYVIFNVPFFVDGTVYYGVQSCTRAVANIVRPLLDSDLDSGTSLTTEHWYFESPHEHVHHWSNILIVTSEIILITGRFATTKWLHCQTMQSDSQIRHLLPFQARVRIVLEQLLLNDGLNLHNM